jgi:hypothetical protein
LELRVVYPKKVGASPIKAASEIVTEILAKRSCGIFSNFIEHSGEINHSEGFLISGDGSRFHAADRLLDALIENKAHENETIARDFSFVKECALVLGIHRMIAKKVGVFSAIGMAWLLVDAHARPIQVTDLKGRAIEIEVLSQVGSTVTFRRVGNAKEFSLPLSEFSESSQKIIREEGSQLPAVLPKIQAEVVVGKRRSKGDSSFMVRQDITCTVKLANPSLAIEIPNLRGKIVFIGQDRRTPEILKILSAQSLECTISPGKTFIQEMEVFVTTYDSDNKGVGNIGGSQYMGYILVMTDAAGNVVLSQTVTGSFRQAIEARPESLKELLTYSQGAELTEKLEPSP